VEETEVMSGFMRAGAAHVSWPARSTITPDGLIPKHDSVASPPDYASLLRHIRIAIVARVSVYVDVEI
jgi:hypothetical protein